MTCIIGYVDKTGITMGADSCGADSSFSYTIRRDEKVFIRDNMIFGFTTSFRMGQLLEHVLAIPKYRPKEQSLIKYMCDDFITAIRKCFKDNEFAKVQNNENQGGDFLVGFEGRLFQIFSDYQVAEPTMPYEACGCGEQYARGAMYVLEAMKLSTERKIRSALEAVTHFSAGVQAPFHIKHLPYKGDKK